MVNPRCSAWWIIGEAPGVQRGALWQEEGGEVFSVVDYNSLCSAWWISGRQRWKNLWLAVLDHGEPGI